MDELDGIKTEPELDLAEIEYIGVEPQDIPNLLIKQEYEYEYSDESDINVPTNLEAKAFLEPDSDDLTCKYCGKVLSTKQSLRGHLRIHSGQFYECDYIGCSRKFTRKADLKYHINTHTGQALFKCSLCPKTYARKCLLRYHEKKHEIEPEQLEPWEKLPIERYSYENEESNQIECNSHTENSHDESNQKLECHEELPSEANLDTHLRKQSFRFGCNICSVKFSKKSHFDLHLITHINEHQPKEHTVKRATALEESSQRTSKRKFRISEIRINHLNYQCYCCRQTFHDKKSLDEHMKVHTDVVICGWCDETFPIRINFQNHLPCNKNPLFRNKRKHLLNCSHCSKKFASAYTLAAHQKLHTGKDLFICTACDKPFHTKSLLKQHELTHSLDRQWCCSFCGMRFKMSRTLEEHERIHEGIKRFECKICKTKFMQSSTLWRHNKLVHGQTKTDTKE